MTGDPVVLHRSTLAGGAGDLAGIRATTSGGVVVEPVPFLSQVDVRVDPAHVGRSPVVLPTEPNTAAESDARAALWLGPDQWLVLGPPGTAQATVAELETALADLHHSVVDVSANRVALEMLGPEVRPVLEMGCGLDLHPRSWGPGRCAQTLLARVPVILHQRDGSTGILVRPSLAGYLIDWMVQQVAD